MNDNNTISFNAELIKRLNGAAADVSVAVAEAAMTAVCQDKRVTVRAFAGALREVAPMLGTSNAVFGAALKSAKEKDATLDRVCQAMADAADKKRADDRKRAADRAAAKPGKDLEKANAKQMECKLALRSPLQKAIDDLTAADLAVKAAAEAWRSARAARRAARDAYKAAVQAVKDESNEPKTEKTEKTAA